MGAGPKEDLLPPPTPLTRFKKDVAAKQAGVAARRSRGPRLPDQSRCGEIEELTTTSLCVRLNTLSVRGRGREGRGDEKDVFCGIWVEVSLGTLGSQVS